jgi:hypothetical protein
MLPQEDESKPKPVYVSNPDLQLELGVKANDKDYYGNQAQRVATRFVAIMKDQPIEAQKAEKAEFLGFLKYLMSTIKLLEIKLQFFGDEFFTYIPDASEGATKDGNMHLFAADKDNLTYLKDNIKGKKVETLTNIKNGLNLAFFAKVIRTCLANQDAEQNFTDKASGVMFQKFLNATLTDFNASDEFILPIYNNVFYH